MSHGTAMACDNENIYKEGVLILEKTFLCLLAL